MQCDSGSDTGAISQRATVRDASEGDAHGTYKAVIDILEARIQELEDTVSELRMELQEKAAGSEHGSLTRETAELKQLRCANSEMEALLGDLDGELKQMMEKENGYVRAISEMEVKLLVATTLEESLTVELEASRADADVLRVDAAQALSQIKEKESRLAAALGQSAELVLQCSQLQEIVEGFHSAMEELRNSFSKVEDEQRTSIMLLTEEVRVCQIELGRKDLALAEAVEQQGKLCADRDALAAQLANVVAEHNHLLAKLRSCTATWLAERKSGPRRRFSVISKYGFAKESLQAIISATASFQDISL